MMPDTDVAPAYAPIVLFVYNRVDHTRQTVEALARNSLADKSDLFIYSDGPKTPAAEASVAAVRQYIKTVKGFNNVTILEKDKNQGLARSIIEGVSSVVQQYGKVIVLEDDILTAPDFLSFMNNGLEYYAAEPRVWQVTGWNFPVEMPDATPVFFSTMVNCWGWATWKDRWQHFNKEPKRLVDSWDKATIKAFNLDNAYDYWSQVLMNLDGRMCTWAVFWYATVFEHQGLSLNPAVSYVKNIGFDGSGEHCNEDQYAKGVLNPQLVDVGNIPVAASMPAQKAIRHYLRQQKPPFIKRLYRRVKVLLKS